MKNHGILNQFQKSNDLPEKCGDLLYPDFDEDIIPSGLVLGGVENLPQVASLMSILLY